MILEAQHNSETLPEKNNAERDSTESLKSDMVLFVATAGRDFETVERELKYGTECPETKPRSLSDPAPDIIRPAPAIQVSSKTSSPSLFYNRVVGAFRKTFSKQGAKAPGIDGNQETSFETFGHMKATVEKAKSYVKSGIPGGKLVVQSARSVVDGAQPSGKSPLKSAKSTSQAGLPIGKSLIQNIKSTAKSTRSNEK